MNELEKLRAEVKIPKTEKERAEMEASFLKRVFRPLFPLCPAEQSSQSAYRISPVKSLCDGLTIAFFVYYNSYD